ncbi:hypothetical protein ACS0TY_002765 [Phlomoides rotata]
MRHNGEQTRSVEEIQTTLALVEKIKSASDEREVELEMEIQKSEYKIKELKANLMDKETELQGICEENESLTVKLESSLSGQRGNELEKKLIQMASLATYFGLGKQTHRSKTYQPGSRNCWTNQWQIWEFGYCSN